MVKLGRVLAGTGVVLLVCTSITAGASSPPEQPLPVQSTTLAQDGQDLVWTVVLQQPFSPTDLAHNHRSLCLALARRLVCVTGRHGRPALQYLSGSARRSLTATITRTSSHDLRATFLPAELGLGYNTLHWQVLSTVNPPACASVGGCFLVAPARPVQLRLHVPRLVGCTASGPDWVSHGPANVREVALTFDDGPYGTPPSIDFVNLLAREHANATFFEIGRQISEYDRHGAVERRMLADGDMIGDHTWSHPDMTTLSASEQRAQLTTTAEAIRKATGGFEPCLFRAPYGAVDAQVLTVARSVGMATIQWNVDPRDWALPGVNAIVSNVVANARGGSIVIEHFGGGPRYQTLAALPAEITALRHRGYSFVTVPQMLGYKLIYK